MATKKSAWTEADYEAKGQVRVNLRLAKKAAETLSEVSHISGHTRQRIIEMLLANPALLASIPKAEMEQPLREPSDYVDPKPSKKKARKK